MAWIVKLPGKRRGLILLLVAITAIGVYAALKYRPLQKVEFADGTKLMLTRVMVGTTNKFKHGNPIERLIGAGIPTNGVHFGKWVLRQPSIVSWSGAMIDGEPVPELSLELQLDPATNSLAQALIRPPFYRSLRVLHWGDDGFPFVEEFREPFKKYRDGFFAYVHTPKFSRRSRMIHLQLQGRDTSEGLWKVLGQFEFQNPRQQTDAKWTVETYPIKRGNGELTVSLDQVSIRTNTNPYNDIWLHTVELPFKFVVNGDVVTNWAASQMEIRDSTGNWMFLGAEKRTSNGFCIYDGWRSPDPNAIWRLKGHIAPDSGFASSNVFTFTIPVPTANPIQTNVADVTVMINLANQHLSVTIPTNRSELRLLFLDAKNKGGEHITDFSGSWGQHQIWQSLKTEKVQESITLTVALVREFEFEFTLKPKMLEKIGPPGVVR